MGSLNTTSALNSTIGFNATTASNVTNGLNTTVISPASSTRDGLPLQPRLTPAFGVAGALLILTGLAYACASIRLYMFLSCAYLASICITVLIVYVMTVSDDNVSDGIQGAYLVAIVLPGVILGGVLQQYVQWLAKRSGCIVGGFCMAMWIEVLCPGGLITSSSMLALFVALMCLAALAPSFLKKTKEPAYMVFSAFSGTTALVLGIDCYSRAGLKEFWVYTWQFHRVKLFGFGTTTYSLTRGIKAEIGMIPVLFALALVFQGKFWKPIRARKERQAAAEAELEEEKERRELETGRGVQEDVGKELALWERRYREPEKKKPEVEQRQVEPPSPTRTDRKLHSATSFILNKLKPDTRAVAIATSQQHLDEIRPVGTAMESTQAITNDAQTRRPPSPRRYPSLRPTSYPPPPIVPQTDYEFDADSDGAENRAWDSIADQDAADIGSSIQLSERHENEENSPTSIKLSQQDLSDWKQHLTQQALDEHEANGKHLPFSNQEDVNEPLQYAHTRSNDLVVDEGSKNRGLDEPSADVSQNAAARWRQREEAKHSVDEWRKTLKQPELNSKPASVRSHDAKDEPSLWTGFEGTHTSDGASNHVEGHERAASQPLQHGLSRAGALKQDKRKSRRLSDNEGKTAILPTPVKSARVNERNSSLPMLDTGSTLLDNRTTIAEQRNKQASLTNNFLSDETQGVVARKNFGSHGRFVDGKPNIVESTDLDEITLSQVRATLHARSMSNSQSSTNSSHPRRASSSVGCQSPDITTARTTPTVSSPVQNYPPFMMVAHPLRSPYPMPPCETVQPTTPAYRHSSGTSNPSAVHSPAAVARNNDLWTPRTPRRSSVPAPFPEAQPTLIHRMNFDENMKRQNEENLRNAQRRGTAEAAENKKRLDARRHVALRAETMMRSGQLDIRHQEAMRKIQRAIEKNCQ
ncbi:hypothetical protein QM012_000730 [Aureobasidium pullulans]|uniref:TM7S3/TM198-like domain-containing protein n=1 Tax=Aureobasidium pullulans TaxID=5580 RepID=A0ABR0TXF6_AURPU